MTDVQHSSTDRSSPLYPRYGELWDEDGHTAFVAGNCIDEDGKIWLLDWETGGCAYRPVTGLRLRADRHRLSQEEILERLSAWAREGNADAMWWLAWWYEGTNHQRSCWYYVAALRADPQKHKWAHERIYSDARNPIMCEGVEEPDLDFIHDIPELEGKRVGYNRIEVRIGPNWEAAVAAAEAAVHVAARHGVKERRCQGVAAPRSIARP